MKVSSGQIVGDKIPKKMGKGAVPDDKKIDDKRVYIDSKRRIYSGLCRGDFSMVNSKYDRV